MPINEKEYNGNLFDQLSLIERLESAIEKDGVEAPELMKQIELEKKQINRKLYQNPPMVES